MYLKRDVISYTFNVAFIIRNGINKSQMECNLERDWECDWSAIRSEVEMYLKWRTIDIPQTYGVQFQ